MPKWSRQAVNIVPFIVDFTLSSMARKPKPPKPEQGQEGSEEDRLAGVLKRLARLLGRAYAREWLAKGNLATGSGGGLSWGDWGPSRQVR